MKKRVLVALSCLLCSLVLLPSCDNDDEKLPKQKTKEEDIHWGYFEGTIGGKEISLKNTGYPNIYEPVSSQKRGVWPLHKEGPDTINIMNTVINYDDYNALSVFLYDLKPGVRYLTKSWWEDWFVSYMALYHYYRGPEDKIKVVAEYIPKEDDPFQVEIMEVIWVDFCTPIIKVELDGTLYNKEYPYDPIAIKGIYESR